MVFKGNVMSTDSFKGKTQQDLSVPKRRKPHMKNSVPKAAGRHTEEKSCSTGCC